MSKNNSTESSPIMKAPEGNVGNEPDALILTQEEVKEQISSPIAPLNR